MTFSARPRTLPFLLIPNVGDTVVLKTINRSGLLTTFRAVGRSDLRVAGIGS